MTLELWIATFCKIIFLLAICMGPVPILVWFERRGSAWMQGRVGPNRVGPFGLLQSLADVIKFFFKEDFVPAHARKIYYYLAPAIALAAPLAAMSLLPFASAIQLNSGVIIPLQVAQVDSGFLLILAFAGLEVYPIILAGWSSNNKYSVLGALRGSAQIISYEISMGLALISMLLAYGTLSPIEIVHAQQAGGTLGFWGCFLNPLGAFIFLVCIFAETNRAPFDLPEGESELVAGFHLEYGAMKFALFFLAEYVAMIMASTLLATIFLGGFGLLPGFATLVQIMTDATHFPALNVRAFFEFISLAIKVGLLLFLFVWIRWTLPRFRFDQLMNLGWKILFPLSLVNLLYMCIAVMLLNR